MENKVSIEEVREAFESYKSSLSAISFYANVDEDGEFGCNLDEEVILNFINQQEKQEKLLSLYQSLIKELKLEVSKPENFLTHCFTKEGFYRYRKQFLIDSTNENVFKVFNQIEELENEKRKTNKKKYPKSPTVPRHSNYPKTKP